MVVEANYGATKDQGCFEYSDSDFCDSTTETTGDKTSEKLCITCLFSRIDFETLKLKAIDVHVNVSILGP